MKAKTESMLTIIHDPRNRTVTATKTLDGRGDLHTPRGDNKVLCKNESTLLSMIDLAEMIIGKKINFSKKGDFTGLVYYSTHPELWKNQD